jgi:hypothetical protein
MTLPCFDSINDTTALLDYSFPSATINILKQTMLVKYLYTIFIAILFALFVGVGISAFYTTPKSPEYPAPLSYPQPPDKMTASNSAIIQRDQEKYDRAFKQYTKDNQLYQRNVSIIALVAAIIMVVLGLTIFAKLTIIPDSLLLGGMFTLIYSIVRGFASEDEKFRFIVIAASLLIVLFLAYKKFITSPQKK